MLGALSVFLILLLLGACTPAAERPAPAPSSHQALAAILPPAEELLPWRVSSPPRYFTTENLWEYMNGAAEAYRAAGVVELVTLEYAAPEAASPIVVEIYQMRTTAGSQTIYRKETAAAGRTINIGDEGRLARGLLAFYQGRYYVKLLAFTSSPALEAALEKLASTLAKRIKD